MSEIQVEQKTYQMSQDGITIAHFLNRRRRRKSILRNGLRRSRSEQADSKGAPGYIQIANTWLLVPRGRSDT